ncbi:MAG TPA: type II toxin-antitoxin system VapC family toxin [Spirochaetia bacterium]|nr:type II toxin-antitoxin system VapC family toxin [Spirochaetia bacterium]
MTVVDANIIVYAITTSERTEEARTLLSSCGEIAVPILWRSECLSALVVLARTGRLERRSALSAFAAARQAFQSSEREVDYSLAFELALEHGISAYDAQYVALAAKLRAKLVTNDRGLASRCPEIAVLLDEETTDKGETR